ncbi:hypothetical protein M495_14490 [Serratia liquefaciens ATCC 27592]|uniref:hypothetical protein n=1 Tax=Serratia liquefaciens TaxID=614 RepID=UPI00035853D5|nr:hypothetical protein [Serratia liquefaciens]AGQ28775.1 hypothetical protein M495_14490 [Serratia liquefaciens ATCC 27592]
MRDLAMKVLKWQSSGRVGVSSATMASIALGLKKPFYGDQFSPPWDPADLTRCMKLVECIPEIRDHFQTIGKRCKKFAPILDHWDELVEMVKQEWAVGNRAPKTYARMKQLLGE